MKKFQALSASGLIVVICLALFAQQPEGRGGQGAPGGDAGARGGQRGRGRGGRGGNAPAPPPTGPVADATNAIVGALNTQDAAFLRIALSQDAIMVDEDGHVGLPANVWALRLTLPAKKMAISDLLVGELGDSGAWAAFNYTLDETTAQGEGNQTQPNQIQGSGTIVYSKSATVLKAVLMQMSVKGRAITPH